MPSNFDEADQMSKDFDTLDSLTEEEDEDDDDSKYRVMPDVASGSGSSSYSQPRKTMTDEGKARSKLRRKFEETGPPIPSKKVKGRQPASAADFGDDQWRDLHAAVQQIALENMARLYELAPSLDPWRPKGRLNEKVRQFFRHARGASPGSMGLTAVELSLSPTSSQKSSQGSVQPASSQDSSISTSTMASTTSSTSARVISAAPTSSPKAPTSAASSQTYHWPVKQPHHHPHQQQHHPYQQHQQRHSQGAPHLHRPTFEPPALFAHGSTSSIFSAMRPCTEPGARKRRLSELPAPAGRAAPGAASGAVPAFGLGLGLGLYTNANGNGSGSATAGGRMYDGGSGAWRQVGLGAGGARAGVAAGLNSRAAAAAAAPATATGGREVKGERGRAHGHARGY